DADVGFDVDEAAAVEMLGVDDRRVDVGEDLEFARAAHVVAVAGGSVADDAVAVGGGLDLAGFERLDHALLFGHATDPAVGLDAHAGTGSGAIGRPILKEARTGGAQRPGRKNEGPASAGPSGAAMTRVAETRWIRSR